MKALPQRATPNSNALREEARKAEGEKTVLFPDIVADVPDMFQKIWTLWTHFCSVPVSQLVSDIVSDVPDTGKIDDRAELVRENR